MTIILKFLFASLRSLFSPLIVDTNPTYLTESIMISVNSYLISGNKYAITLLINSNFLTLSPFSVFREPSYTYNCCMVLCSPLSLCSYHNIIIRLASLASFKSSEANLIPYLGLFKICIFFHVFGLNHQFSYRFIISNKSFSQVSAWPTICITGNI